MWKVGVTMEVGSDGVAVIKISNPPVNAFAPIRGCHVPRHGKERVEREAQAWESYEKRMDERFDKLFKLLNDMGYVEMDKQAEGGLSSNTETPLETFTEAEIPTHRVDSEKAPKYAERNLTSGMITPSIPIDESPIAESIELVSEGKCYISEKMNKFLAEDVGTVGQVLCAALQDELLEYYKLLVALNIQLLNQVVVLANYFSSRRTLQAFEFCDTFVPWIQALQSDPLPLLLLCFVDDVLSKGFSRLTQDPLITQIKYSPGANSPTQRLYVNAVLVFSMGVILLLKDFMNLFQLYGDESGQIISDKICQVLIRKAVGIRKDSIISAFGVRVGPIPLKYFSVPIYIGNPTTAQVMPMPTADKVRTQLSCWEWRLFFMKGTVHLVKSVIHIQLIFSFSIYSWPFHLLKKMDTGIGSFVWTDDPNQKPLIIVVSHKLCDPTEEMGINIHKLSDLNRTSVLKLKWDFMILRNQWSNFRRKNFFIRAGEPISYYKSSSMWYGLKRQIPFFELNTEWILDNGERINLETLDLPSHIHPLHGDPLVQEFVAFLLCRVCSPLFELVRSSILEREIVEAASPIGQDFSIKALINVEQFVGKVMILAGYRTRLHEYLMNEMNDNTLNSASLIGEIVGACLISHVGSLPNLVWYTPLTAPLRILNQSNTSALVGCNFKKQQKRTNSFSH
ncbi:hypothetical protein IFM89_037256 [Coptis chinensis]|uniref:Nop domain-containing protein n=1 Tax=Coptis chinensis TaxID=261450 RepID=A0A835I8L3_9MAGN|nr:hypothetical protein IFM89_037256 [Coptis chinensis]